MIIRYALAIAEKLLAFYEDFLGSPFPMPKQDMLAVPGLDGAMENWGLIMFGEQYLIFNENTPTSQKETNAVIIAHELAHQVIEN